jgi:hypothetical protein
VLERFRLKPKHFIKKMLSLVGFKHTDGYLVLAFLVFLFS